MDVIFFKTPNLAVPHLFKRADRPCIISNSLPRIYSTIYRALKEPNLKWSGYHSHLEILFFLLSKPRAVHLTSPKPHTSTLQRLANSNRAIMTRLAVGRIQFY
jgi:hypothetical protein